LLEDDGEMLNLNDNNLWRNEKFILNLFRSIKNDGYSEKLTEFLKEVLSRENINSFSDFITQCRICSVSIEDNELKKEIEKFIDTSMEINKSNESCYLRDTIEKSRVIQWPNNPNVYRNDPDKYFDIYKDFFYKNTHRIISKNTPIGSAGSCFATRIAHQLQLWNYNYIIEEDDLPDDIPVENLAHTTYRTSSARVGTLFNIPSMRQMVERAFGDWEPEKIIIQKDGKILDPFRSVTSNYLNVSEFLIDYKKHSLALKNALNKCDVFIFTLGLTEAWKYNHSNEYLSVSPWGVDSTLLRKHNLNADENYEELERMFYVYKKNKPNIKFIISVSPVPLNKTFDDNSHVVVANSYSKSILRVAAQKFVDNHPDDVFYFPSYEVVTYGTKHPWEYDMRHVSSDSVERVMKLFQKIFLVDQKELPVTVMPSVVKKKKLSGKGMLKKILRALKIYK
jgi:GSCFA family protein